MIFITCFILVCSSSIVRSHDKQWIDPHDMGVSNTNSKPYVKHSQAQAPEASAHLSFALEHYKRLITFILNNAAFDDQSSTYKGQINLDILTSDHKLLSHFIREDLNEDPAILRKIDQVMHRILTRSKLEDFAIVFTSWTDYIYFTFYNRTTGIVLSCMGLLLVSYKLLRSNFTLWSVFKYLVFIGWVFDFAFTWIKLLQDAEIQKLTDQTRYKVVPLHCDPDKMSMLQYLWYTISSNEECRRYHSAIYEDIFWTIAPLQVLSHQLGIVIYTPATHIGKAIGSFSSGILTTLPWGVNVILLPLLLLFTLLFIGILLSFSTQTSFHVNFFHLLSFNFGNRERAAVGDILTGRNLSNMIDIIHRNMIEDVRPSAPQTPNTENCTCSADTENKETKSIEEGVSENANIPETVSDTKEIHDDGGGDN